MSAAKAPARPPASAEVPAQSPWLFRWFSRYAARYVARHFHALRVSRGSRPVPADGRPLIFVINHPSWWDVLVALTLLQRFSGYRHFAPIDAAVLPKYRFFARLGFFGIEPGTSGAVRFVRVTRAIFERPHSALWITAQGTFTDPRVRPVELRPGVGYLAASLGKGCVVPVAVEYPFWQEQTPEALVRIGEPLDLSGPTRDRHVWTREISNALGATQDALAAEAIRREPSCFEVIVAGRTGIGGVYDLWRRLRSWTAGRPFDPSHGNRGDAGLVEG